jgi:hypothetical protein
VFVLKEFNSPRVWAGKNNFPIPNSGTEIYAIDLGESFFPIPPLHVRLRGELNFHEKSINQGHRQLRQEKDDLLREVKRSTE